MADYTSFATGFVQQLNKGQEEKTKARREYEKLVDQSIVAANMKAYQSDIDIHTTTSTARAKAINAYESGDYLTLEQIMTEGKDEATAKRTRAYIQKYSGEDEASKQAVLKVLQNQFEETTHPDINSDKYSRKGNAMRASMMAKAPSDQHVIMKAFGVPDNKHLRSIQAMNAAAKSGEVTKKEIKMPEKITGISATADYDITVDTKNQQVVMVDKDTQDVKTVSYGSGSDASNSMNKLFGQLGDMSSKVGKQLSDRLVLNMAKWSAQGQSEVEQYGNALRLIHGADETIRKAMAKEGTYVLNAVDASGNPIQVVVDATGGSPIITTQRATPQKQVTKDQVKAINRTIEGLKLQVSSAVRQNIANTVINDNRQVPESVKVREAHEDMVKRGEVVEKETGWFFKDKETQLAPVGETAPPPAPDVPEAPTPTFTPAEDKAIETFMSKNNLSREEAEKAFTEWKARRGQ